LGVGEAFDVGLAAFGVGDELDVGGVNAEAGREEFGGAAREGDLVEARGRVGGGFIEEEEAPVVLP
jgi:hypothetical protein